MLTPAVPARASLAASAAVDTGPALTKANFLARVGEIEGRLPVAEWKVHGFHVWPLVRLQLFAANANASVLHDAVAGGTLRNAAAMVKTCTAWAHATATDRRNNASASARADAVFLAYSAGTQPVIDGRKCNWLLSPYVDLARGAGKRVAVWEMCHDGDYNIPRSVPSSFIQVQLLSLRVASLFLHPRGSGAPALHGFSDVMASVHSAGLRNRYASLDALERDAYFVRRTADWFKRRLEVVGPSHGFVADYGPREQAFCLACRELGIRSIEVQHGVINDAHPAYAAWQALPDGGYETRPAVFWCWDRTGVAAIEQWAGKPCSGARAVLGGDPWREQWMQDDAAVVRAFDDELEKLESTLGASRHVLVTLDPTGPVVPDLLLEGMRRSPGDWCYWVRLHPLGQRARLPEARRALHAHGIKCAPVDLSSEWPLHALLRHVDVHVTGCWSTVVMEADDFGVSSVACAERAREVFPRQVADGTLRIAATPDELVAALKHQMANRRPRRTAGRVDSARVMHELLSRGSPAARPASSVHPPASQTSER